MIDVLVFNSTETSVHNTVHAVSAGRIEAGSETINGTVNHIFIIVWGLGAVATEWVESGASSVVVALITINSDTFWQALDSILIKLLSNNLLCFSASNAVLVCSSELISAVHSVDSNVISTGLNSLVVIKETFNIYTLLKQKIEFRNVRLFLTDVGLGS